MRDTFVLSLSGPLGMQEQSADLRKEAVSTFLPLAFQCLVSKCVIYTDHTDDIIGTGFTHVFHLV